MAYSIEQRIFMLALFQLDTMISNSETFCAGIVKRVEILASHLRLMQKIVIERFGFHLVRFDFQLV
jgi:hypothetical protein